MTGRRFHHTTEAIPCRLWKAKSPFASRPFKISIKDGTQGVRTRYNTLLLPIISIVWCPGRLVIPVRCFRNPCDRDPPTDNFKNFKFFNYSLKILNVYFGGKDVYFWGKNVYFWGKNVYFWGITFTFGEIAFALGYNRGFRSFWNVFFCCWGVLGLCGLGAP